MNVEEIAWGSGSDIKLTIQPFSNIFATMLRTVTDFSLSQSTKTRSCLTNLPSIQLKEKKEEKKGWLRLRHAADNDQTIHFN